MSAEGLTCAAEALDDQAAGRPTNRATLIAGALALDALVWRGRVDRDLLDAAAGLKMAAEGAAIDLDAAGRARAAELARVVRAAAARERKRKAAP